MTQRFVIRVHGQVQGVGYRWSALTAARRRSLAGFVKNDSDGTVLIHVQGETGNLQAFLTWCKQGPPGASVYSVEVNQVAPIDEVGFRIL
ncbi:MAG: acylphosphatase [Patescibacteria group bacterium]